MGSKVALATGATCTGAAQGSAGGTVSRGASSHIYIPWQHLLAVIKMRIAIASTGTAASVPRELCHCCQPEATCTHQQDATCPEAILWAVQGGLCHPQAEEACATHSARCVGA